jgi:hypothetical protein
MLRRLRAELQPVVRRRPRGHKYLFAWNDRRAPFVISTVS